MLNQRNFCLSLLCSALLGFTACKKDEDEKKDEAESSEDAPQEQFVSKDVGPSNPFVLVYGDSLSTGVLSNTVLGENVSDELALQLGNFVKGGSYNALNFQDNLSNLDIAAATTAEAYGFRAGAAASLGLTAPEIGVITLGKFGARSQDIGPMRARWEQEEANTIKRKPDYILVMLGGNDFCSGNTVEEISKNFMEEIAAVHKNSPDSVLIVAPAPRADLIAAIDFTYGPTLTAISGEELSCRKFREQSCKNVYLPDAAARMDGINAGILAAFEKVKADGAKAVYVEAVNTWQIQAEELSFDCFHPSAAGQEKIGGYIQEALKTSGL